MADARQTSPALRARPLGLVAVLLGVAGLLAACSRFAPVTERSVEVVEFESLTFPGALWDPFMPPIEQGTPVTVSGLLTIPPTDHALPAVILTHGCGGISAGETGWLPVFEDAGYATFMINSFFGRGVTSICSGSETVNLAGMLVDVYRAVDVLAEHPAIDSSHVALMGLSFGGRTALWAASQRFQDRYGLASDGLAAYLAFYPAACYLRLADETEVTGGPLRIFHGEADDWLPIDQCRAYIDRLRDGGVDASLFAYPGAHHGFDAENLPAEQSMPAALSPRNCEFVEQDGAIIDPETGAVASIDAPCVEAGVTIGFDPDARDRAVADVLALLDEVFSR